MFKHALHFKRTGLGIFTGDDAHFSAMLCVSGLFLAGCTVTAVTAVDEQHTADDDTCTASGVDIPADVAESLGACDSTEDGFVMKPDGHMLAQQQGTSSQRLGQQQGTSSQQQGKGELVLCAIQVSV